MPIDSPQDLQGLKRGGSVVKATLRALKAAFRNGVSTLELDQIARAVFARCGARSAPAMEYGFPGTVLISVNEEAVHGIPGKRTIGCNDLVKLDVTPWLDGYVADAAVTVALPVPPGSSRTPVGGPSRRSTAASRHTSSTPWSSPTACRT